MPIRTASFSRRLSRNGQELHRAMMSRGDNEAPSEEELALIEQRRLLKDEREKRKEEALQPKPSAVDRMVRTHHAQPKDKPKATKDGHEGEDVKKPKARRTRADKHAEKAAAIEAARTSKKQGAGKPRA